MSWTGPAEASVNWMAPADGTNGGLGELAGTSGGIGELDGTSGGISIFAGGGTLFAAGGSRLMIPGHPSRGTKISRRLILGGLFCHESVQRLHGGARKHGTRRHGTSFETLY